MDTAVSAQPAGQSGSRHNHVVKGAYYAPAQVEREYERLWPRVWQMVCRAEELPNVGDYLTYEIGAESIIIVRSDADTLNAFYNVCLHRGRRLVDGAGNMANFPCKFHGWRWSIDGTNEHVTQREDWCGSLDKDDLGLGRIRMESWGGFLFVNLDGQAEPLMEYLGEAAEALAPFELHEMRFRWRKWLKMPCNWKVALEAFNEGYHVAITHYPLNRFGTSRFASAAFSRHGTFGIDAAAAEGTVRLRSSTMDLRRSLAEYYRYQKKAIDSILTDTMVYAAQSLPAVLPDDATPAEIVGKLMQLSISIDAERGVTWPSITPEQYQRGGIDWHLFPNTVLLPMATNCLGYRARPDGNDPDSCIFEVYQLERMPKGQEPNPPNLRNDDIYDQDFWGEILLQDFQQMQGTHLGIKSSGFSGSRLNPKQEIPIDNFHRAYHDYLD